MSRSTVFRRGTQTWQKVWFQAVSTSRMRTDSPCAGLKTQEPIGKAVEWASVGWLLVVAAEMDRSRLPWTAVDCRGLPSIAVDCATFRAS